MNFFPFLTRFLVSMSLICLFAGQIRAESSYFQSDNLSPGSLVQEKGLSFSSLNITLKELFETIEDQTDLLVAFSPREIDVNRKLVLPRKNGSVQFFLESALSGTEIGFKIEKDYIILFKKQSVDNLSSGTVSGYVLDENGDPVVGAVVTVSGKSIGSTTDSQGKFVISAGKNDVLKVSCLGYATTEMKAGSGNMRIVLKEDNELLDEVVVVGYGSMKKANLTGATSNVGKETFRPRAVTSATQYLQGASANLNITNDDGGPGKDASINIRGYSGLGTSYAPLIIVDGFTSSLKELNPNDIESITILKDAASAAIYGAQASYGVILVTTKSGKIDAKPSITYSNNISISSPVAVPKTAGSIEFADLMREASLNEGGTGIFSQETLDRISQYYHDPNSIPNTIPPANNPNRWANWGDGQCNANEDWFKEMFKSQVNQMHNIEVTGGGSTAAYQMSLGYVRDEGKLRYFDDNYSKFNANLKVNVDITKWLTVGMNIRYIKEKTITPSYYFSSTVNSLFGWAAMMWPTQPVKDPNGHFTSDGRMAFLHDANPNTAIGDKLSGNVTALLRLAPGLTVNAGVAYNKYVFKQTSSKGLVYAYGVDNQPYLDGGSAPETTQVWQGAENNDYLSTNVYATYEKGFKGHNFKIMAGTQMELSKSYRISGNKTHLIFPSKPAISTAIGVSNVGDGLDHWSTLGFFGRFNYNYKERYLLEVNVRRDGSSRYADKSVPGSPGRWGTFPSVSGGWNIAKEPFFSPLSNTVNELKIRASYGELGNMRGKSYQYISTIDYQSKYGYIINGEQVGAFGWPSMISFNTWEKNRTLDIGADMSFLKNRLALSFDWYKKDIIGLITDGEILPAILGSATPAQNCADIRNKGFELTVSWKDSFRLGNKPFEYSVTAMLSDYQGEVIKYSNPNGVFGNWDWGVPRIWSNYYVGAKMGEIWGFETDHMIMSQDEADALNKSGAQSQIGANWSPGDIKYKDRDGSGDITIGSMTLDDPGDLKVIGNDTPRYNYSFIFSAAWNNFDISFMLQGVGKRDIWMNGVLTQGVGFYSTGSNVWENTLDCYRNDGRNPDPYWPKFYLSDHGWKNLRPQTRYLQSGAYCRLKNLRIGYSIPEKALRKIRMEKLYIYFSGDNLLTFTKLNENMDPENPWDVIPWQTGDIPYPLSRSFSLGLSLTF